MAVEHYIVGGMTCEHCEMSVTEEVLEIPGVERVHADHTTGDVTVEGSGFTDQQVADAINEAGYTLEG